jgi:hypothetical protein
MAPSLLVLSLLAADPDIHGGGALGFGVGVPFKSLNAGFQFSVKGFVEMKVVDKVSVGLVVPFGFGFFSQGTFGVTVNYTTIDIMPGVRGSVAVIDWLHVALEFGLGPSILNAKANLGGFGSSETTRTDFGLRGGLFVEATPPQLPAGVMFFVSPVEMQGRFGNTPWSEYRFSIGAGYRR